MLLAVIVVFDKQSILFILIPNLYFLGYVIVKGCGKNYGLDAFYVCRVGRVIYTGNITVLVIGALYQNEEVRGV